jgi:hypothetical protein
LPIGSPSGVAHVCDATIDTPCCYRCGIENAIVRNVAIYDVNPELGEAGDAFALNEPSRVWIDHVTTKWISDGFSDAALR